MRRWTRSTGATIPAAARVVVAGWADSSHDGGMDGQDAFADGNVGKSSAIHRDPATR